MSIATVSIEEVLAWYAEAGVDEALQSEPVDRFEQSDAIASSREKQRRKPPTGGPAVALAERSPPPRPTLVPSSDAASRAGEIAAACANVADLHAAILAFEGCGLRETARSTVFSSGPVGARLAIVGDIPDREEDREGVPFAGPAGVMLERMLAAIGFAKAEAYLLNASPWRTPGQRQLTPQEKGVLAPFLKRHITLCRSEVLLLMGGAAVELGLGPGARLTRLRGRWSKIDVGERSVPAMATFHPNFLVRQPEQKRLAWGDLLALKDRL